MTPKQKAVLDFISQYTHQHGYALTLREIGDALGLRALATVHKHVEALRAKGHIRRTSQTARSMEVVRDLVGERERAAFEAGFVAGCGGVRVDEVERRLAAAWAKHQEGR